MFKSNRFIRRFFDLIDKQVGILLASYFSLILIKALSGSFANFLLSFVVLKLQDPDRI